MTGARSAIRGGVLTALVVVASVGALSSAAASPASPSHVHRNAWNFTVTGWEGTNVSAYNSANSYTPTTCGHAKVPVAPSFAARNRTAHESVVARLHATGSCRGSLVSSSAAAYLNLSSPIHLTAAAHTVTVNWSMTYNASEWVNVPGTCPRSYNGSCWTESDYLVYDTAYIWDNTSKVSYCVWGSPSGPYGASFPSCGLSDYEWSAHCVWWYLQGYGCNWGSNFTINGTVRGNSVIDPTFYATHQYLLIVTVGTRVACESYGYAAGAYASVDLARPYGSTMTAITVH